MSDFSKSGRPIHDPGLVEAANARQQEIREATQQPKSSKPPKGSWWRRLLRRS
jgi:hypothetical protein